MRPVAFCAFLALKGAVVPRVRRQQLSDALKLILADLDGLIVTSEAGVRLLGNEQVIGL